VTTNYLETLDSGKLFYTSDFTKRNVGTLLDGEGYAGFLYKPERTYFTLTRLDVEKEVLTMKVYPGIHCEEAALTQLNKYISKINACCETGSLQVGDDRSLFAMAKQTFIDSPIQTEAYQEMEECLLETLEIFMEPLEKMAHSKSITPDESDVESMISVAKNKRLKQKTSIKDFLKSVHVKVSVDADASAIGIPPTEEVQEMRDWCAVLEPHLGLRGSQPEPHLPLAKGRIIQRFYIEQRKRLEELRERD